MTSSRRLILLRHGQTEWNAINRGQGHSDVELNDVGHAQAAAIAPLVAALSPVVLWSSDLARARQTAAYVAKEAGLEALGVPRLREFDLGERTGILMSDYAAQFPEEFAAFRSGQYDAVPGAETSAAVAARMSSAVLDLSSVIEPGETAVAVSHGGAMRVGLCALLGWPFEGAQSALRGLRPVGNCSWIEIEQSADHGLRLAAYNVGVPV